MLAVSTDFLRGEIVVIALCLASNCHDYFPAAPNAVFCHVEVTCFWDCDSKPAAMC